MPVSHVINAASKYIPGLEIPETITPNRRGKGIVNGFCLCVYICKKAPKVYIVCGSYFFHKAGGLSLSESFSNMDQIWIPEHVSRIVLPYFSKLF